MNRRKVHVPRASRPLVLPNGLHLATGRRDAGATFKALPPGLLKKIKHARCLPDRSLLNLFVTPATVAETLDLRARKRSVQSIMTKGSSRGGQTADKMSAPPPADKMSSPPPISQHGLHNNALFLTYLAEDGAVRTYTYAEFYRTVRRMAAALQIFAGVQRGDRIATAMHNHDQLILICFAAWHIGASVVPLNMGENDKRLSYILAHSGAKTLFVLSEYLERMRPLGKNTAIQYAIVVPDNLNVHVPIETIMAKGMGVVETPGSKGVSTTPITNNGLNKASRLPGAVQEVNFQDILPPVDVPQFAQPEKLKPDDEALIVYTSGTTGVPKGVVLSQYNLVADAYAITRWHRFTAETRMMCVLPVHHVNGLVVTHITPMFFGGSVVLNRKFSARNFFQTVAEHKIHVVSMVPTLLQFLLEATPRGFDNRIHAPSLRYIICGAGPLTVDLAARFEDRFGIPICHGYGLSESTCYSCFLPVQAPMRLKGEGRGCRSADEHTRWMRGHGYPSIGIPVETNLMAIHDDKGRALPEGVKGEIVIRGHNIMKGYLDNLSENANAFTHGWFRSGDEGFFKFGADGQPYFFISGRFKELIIRGGVKISPLEIDEVLNRIPGVKAAMSVGFENVTYGEEVGAYVVKRPGCNPTPKAILSACRDKLSFAMSPKVVIFGKIFPVTSTGKYQRNQLKPLFLAYREVQFREEKKA